MWGVFGFMAGCSLDVAAAVPARAAKMARRNPGEAG